MEYVSYLLLGFLLAMVLGQMIIPHVMVISLRKRLFDIPDARKVHQSPISRLGGVTFFPVVVLVMCGISMIQLHTGTLHIDFFSRNIIDEMLCLMMGLMLLYIIGITDDLIGVSYRRKFLVQLVAAAFIPLAGLQLDSFYGLFGIYHIDTWLSVPLTIGLTVFITNAINLIDGIDGLASGLCMEALVLFGLFFVWEGWWMYALLAAVCVGVLIPFFLHNVFGNASRGRKIFMGDTGSLTLGFILSLLSIKFIGTMGASASLAGGASLVLVFSFLLVPCLDVCRVMLGRIRRKMNPFKPDKSHIHHKFLNMGFTPRRSLVLIQLLSLAFIAFTYFLIRMGMFAGVVLVLDLLIWTGMNVWFSLIINRKELAYDRYIG